MRGFLRGTGVSAQCAAQYCVLRSLADCNRGNDTAKANNGTQCPISCKNKTYILQNKTDWIYKGLYDRKLGITQVHVYQIQTVF